MEPFGDKILPGRPAQPSEVTAQCVMGINLSLHRVMYGLRGNESAFYFGTVLHPDGEVSAN
jgi:hypothetical protein